MGNRITLQAQHITINVVGQDQNIPAVQPRRRRLDVWRERKDEARRMAEAMRAAGFENRAARMAMCAWSLHVKECPRDGYVGGVQTMRCRDRLCPLCMWRRADQLAAQVIAEAVELKRQEPSTRFLLVTLTAKNAVEPGELKETIKAMTKAWHTLMRRPLYKRAWLGWVRRIEITRGADGLSWHPHMHVMVAVQTSYFTERTSYKTTAQVVEDWRTVMGLDYDPICDIRAVSELGGGVREVAKYSVKPADITHIAAAGDVLAVRTLAYALKNIRLVQWGGMWADVRTALGHTEDDDGQDVSLDNETTGQTETCPHCGTALQETIYQWAGRSYEAVAAQLPLGVVEDTPFQVVLEPTRT